MSLQTAYKKVGELVNANLVKELEQQGHKMTGALEGSLEAIPDNAGVTGIGNLYGIFLNLGVKAEQIRHPYARARIEGLTKFAELRMGLSGKEAVGVAYAIATTHAREGMPTSGSFKYSKNGKRTDSIDDAIEASEAGIIEILFEEFTNVIDIHTKVTGR